MGTPTGTTLYGWISSYHPRDGKGIIDLDIGIPISFTLDVLGATNGMRLLRGQCCKVDVPAEIKRLRRKPDEELVAALRVELIQAMPGAYLQDSQPKSAPARHPKARKRKPTWRNRDS